MNAMVPLLENEQLLYSIKNRQKNLSKLSEYLSELESQLSLIFSASPDMIVFMDQEGNVLKISDAVYTILGYSRPDIVGRSMWDFVAEEDLKATKNYFKQLTDKKIVYGNTKSLVNHWVAKTGEHIKLVWRVTFCDDREKQFIAVASDITEFGPNSKYNIKLLQKTLEYTTDGIFITDAQNPSNVIVYVNGAFEDITGFTKDEVLYQNFKFLLTDESINSRAIATLKQSVSEGKGCELLLQTKRKNGELFYNRLVISPVVEHNVVVNFIGSIKDVSKDISVKYEWSPNTHNGYCEVK